MSFSGKRFASFSRIGESLLIQIQLKRTLVKACTLFPDSNRWPVASAGQSGVQKCPGYLDRTASGGPNSQQPSSERSAPRHARAEGRHPQIDQTSTI